MRREKHTSWSRLDNAAKIFPSTVEKSDTRVFRFSCELNDDIDPELLQKAADRAAESYPTFNMIMKKGLFWYYLENCDLKPVVTEENDHVCAAIYEEDARSLLYRITYHRSRINLEVFHVIADGTGAIMFLKTIVYRYLIYRYAELFEGELPVLDNDASFSQKNSDSFSKYYDKSIKKPRTKRIKAFRLKCERLENNRLSVIEGFASVKSVIAAAHNNKTTLTVFLTALYIKALSMEMSVQSRKKPVVINIPVNLRQFFPSETAKNFFGMISVKYDFFRQDGSLEDIISCVDRQFKEQLTKEKLAVRMNSLAALEHNPFVRIAPLPLKNRVLRIARHITVKGETSVISNVGRIQMPQQFDELIKSFSVFVSTGNIQLNICSFNDVLQMGITSCYASTDVQRNFFRALTSQGIEVTIRSNDSYAERDSKEEAEECSSAENAK
ncbi:MAG: hypothetical protein J6K92_03165 [Oscillospiraceae bacterium]|nr:hypothetical protein [Oscillospiraceae bacterium]